MANLGFIGLGMMGSRIVKRLMAAGNTVTGYNRTKSKANELIASGMKWAPTPHAVTESSDIVFSMVTDTKALKSIFDGEHGVLVGLRPGQIYVEMSTVSPGISKELAAQVREKGAHMVDAPISGSPGTVEAGQAFVMAAGEPEAYQKVEPYLLQIGARAAYMGQSGNAILMKVAINLSLPVQLLALYEGVLLAEKGGIPRQTALDAILHSVAASPHMKYRAPFIMSPPQEVWFNVDMIQKDLQLALEAGQELQMPMLGASLANEIATSARAMGLGQEDFAAMFKVLAKMAGVEA